MFTSAKRQNINSNFSALRMHSKQWENITHSFKNFFEHLQGQFQQHAPSVKIEVRENIEISYLTKRIEIQVNPIIKNTEVFGVISVLLENGAVAIELEKYLLNRSGILQNPEGETLFDVEYAEGDDMLWLQNILSEAMGKETRQSIQYS